MDSSTITTTNPALALRRDDLDLPAYASSIVAPFREPNVLLAACGGAVGTMIAVALVASLFLLLGGSTPDAIGPLATAGAEPGAAIAMDPRAKHETTDRDVLVVRRAAPAARKHPSPRVVRAAPRPHHAARRPHTSVMEVADALARAELESTLP